MKNQSFPILTSLPPLASPFSTQFFFRADNDVYIIILLFLFSSDYSTHRLRMRGRSKSPETLGHEEYPHKRIHMPHVDSTYDNSTGRGGCGGNRDSMLHENYENSQYVPQQQPVPPSPAKKVYVGNLSGRTDFHGLNRLFSRCGRILHIDVKYDQAGIVTPHAVITFAYDSSVSDAVHFYSETELDGHTIVVRIYVYNLYL